MRGSLGTVQYGTYFAIVLHFHSIELLLRSLRMLLARPLVSQSLGSSLRLSHTPSNEEPGKPGPHNPVGERTGARRAGVAGDGSSARRHLAARHVEGRQRGAAAA